MTPARIMRIATPRAARTIVSTGRTSARGVASALVSEGMSEIGGSRPSHVAKTRMTAEPITKSGSAMNPSVACEIA